MCSDRSRQTSRARGPAQERQSGRESRSSINLPRGGGALRGVGEVFAAHPANGSASASVPLPVSPSRSGFTPQLSLSYDSGRGNGPFGLGWSLALPQIARKTERGLPRYRDGPNGDDFTLTGAEDLVPERDAAGALIAHNRGGFLVHRYRPRIEGAFARIERWTRLADGDMHWRSISPTNIASIYGASAASRVADPFDPARVFAWLIDETRDDKGNLIRYVYAAENDANIAPHPAEAHRTPGSRGGERYLKRVLYGNRTSHLVAEPAENDFLFELVFDYGEGHVAAAPGDRVSASPVGAQSWTARPDPWSRCRAGFELRSYRRCERVLMFHNFAELGAGATLVAATDLSYADASEAEGPPDIRGSAFGSLLTGFTRIGYLREGGDYVAALWPTVRFDYSLPAFGAAVDVLEPDGIAPHVPPTTRWTDLDGEGLPGLLSDAPGAWLYRPNRSQAPGQPPHAALGLPETLRALPHPLPPLASAVLGDFEGRGRTALVSLERPAPGLTTRREGSWDVLRPFREVPVIDFEDPSVRFVDLTGDGVPDVVILCDAVVVWHAGSGDAFGPAERVPLPDDHAAPTLLAYDTRAAILFADMTGDGLSDLVRVANGSVVYLPNLGYGRFGAPVTMAAAPLFDTAGAFDPQRLRVADVTGNGAADLIYISGEGNRAEAAVVALNACGNGWSAPQRLAFPTADDLSQIDVLDLLGDGTACLVLSSPWSPDSGAPLRYVRLMATKPYLLIRMSNGTGAETHIEYAPSTRFMLADRAAGRPWATQLPFPVQVVVRVERIDLIAKTRFVSRSSYHDGHWDAREREFRGFAMVETEDTDRAFLPGAAQDRRHSSRRSSPAAISTPAAGRMARLLLPATAPPGSAGRNCRLPCCRTTLLWTRSPTACAHSRA